MKKSSKLQIILKEPLVHFLLIGAGLFFLYSLVDSSKAEDKNQIYITKERLASISSQWIKSKGKEPTDKEMQEQLKLFIEDEIFYREALEKGLEKNDDTIRTHLAQKMKFIFDDLTTIPKPTEKELKKYLSDNSSKFIEDASASFNQVVFTPKQKLKNIEEEAKQFLLRLQSSKSKKVSSIGDIFELTQKGIRNTFGEKFSTTIFSLPLKSWQGPFKTKYGIHLLYVHSREKAQLPEFSQIKQSLKVEWQKTKRDEANGKFYKELSKSYEVIINK